MGMLEGDFHGRLGHASDMQGERAPERACARLAIGAASAEVSKQRSMDFGRVRKAQHGLT